MPEPVLLLLPCERARRALREALGTTGLPAEAARHLQACEGCRREADSVGELVRRLRALPLAEPSETFWEALPSRVVARAREKRRRPAWALGALAAAALLLLTIVPAERELGDGRSTTAWLAEVAVTDSWLDSLGRAESAEEAARAADRMIRVAGLGPGTVQQMVWAAEQAVVHRPETPAWDLLERLRPEEFERVAARLEKGAGR